MRFTPILMLLILMVIVEAQTGVLLNPDLMLYFLRSQYVPSIGLLRAARMAYPENVTIYIANDNVLASRALAVLGDRDLSSRILTKLNDEYNGGFNGKIDILLGIDIPGEFYVPKNELVAEINGYRIVWEKPGDQVMDDWYEYADLLVYRALDKLLWGSRPHAELLFLNLTRMWDGHGFRDKAYNGVYATYKCALFVYLYRALEAAGSRIVRDYTHIRNRCIDIITLAQDRETGGIKTDYRIVDGRVIPEGDVNVETTSIVVLALFSDYPLVIARNTRERDPITAHTYIYISAMVVVILILLVVIILIRLGSKTIESRVSTYTA